MPRERSADSSGLISMTITGCTFVLRFKLLLWAVILQHLAGSCRAWIDTSRAPTSARLCTDERSERLPCQLELADIAEFKPAPPTTGPGDCTATDPVNVEAVLLPGNQSGVHSDSHAAMLEAVVHWIRDDVTLKCSFSKSFLCLPYPRHKKTMPAASNAAWMRASVET